MSGEGFGDGCRALLSNQRTRPPCDRLRWVCGGDSVTHVILFKVGDGDERRKSRGPPPPPPASASLALPADNRSPFQCPSCQPGGLSLRLLLCPIALPVAGPSLASWKSPLACSLRPRAYTGLAAGSRPTGPAAVRSPGGAIPSRGRAPGLQGAWRSRWVASVSCCLGRAPPDWAQGG